MGKKTKIWKKPIKTGFFKKTGFFPGFFQIWFFSNNASAKIKFIFLNVGTIEYHIKIPWMKIIINMIQNYQQLYSLQFAKQFHFFPPDHSSSSCAFSTSSKSSWSIVVNFVAEMAVSSGCSIQQIAYFHRFFDRSIWDEEFELESWNFGIMEFLSLFWSKASCNITALQELPFLLLQSGPLHHIPT